MIETLKSPARAFKLNLGWPRRSSNRPPRSLGNQLVMWNVLVLVLVLNLVGVIVYALFVQRLMTETDQRLAARAQDMQHRATGLAVSDQATDAALYAQLADSEADEFAAEPIYVRFLNKGSGVTLAQSRGLNQEQLRINSAIEEATGLDKSVVTTRQDQLGRQVRVLTFPIYDAGRQVVALGEVNQSLQTVEQVKLILITVLALGSLIAATTSYGVIFWLTNRKLRPLSELATTMHGLSVQGLQTRLPTQHDTVEVELLTAAFNGMAERLEASFSLQRSFVADVSHELRTPLTTMRGELDVMLLNPQLEETSRQDIEQVGGELDRLSRLVANLLTNARAEAGFLPEIRQHSQPVALDLLLVEIARQARHLNPQVSLEIGELNQLTVPGNRDLLKQLLLNLVDNALTYTRAGGEVEIELSQARSEEGSDSREWAILSVEDTGPGISPDDLPHIFERHYRASRTSARGKLSSGLGLYIACLIARGHDGRITVQSELGKGTSFKVWLPMAGRE